MKTNSEKSLLFQGVRWIVVIAFGVMVVSAWLQVIFRYVIQYPLGWTEELCRIMLFWCSFISLGALVYRRGLMRVDAFVSVFPPKIQAGISVCVHLVQMLFFFWLIYLCMRLVVLADSQMSTALKIPYSYIYLSLPLGLAAAVIYSFKTGWTDFKGILTGKIRVTERGEGEG